MHPVSSVPASSSKMALVMPLHHSISPWLWMRTLPHVSCAPLPCAESRYLLFFQLLCQHGSPSQGSCSMLMSPCISGLLRFLRKQRWLLHQVLLTLRWPCWLYPKVWAQMRLWRLLIGPPLGHCFRIMFIFFQPPFYLTRGLILLSLFSILEWSLNEIIYLFFQVPVFPAWLISCLLTALIGFQYPVDSCSFLSENMCCVCMLGGASLWFAPGINSSLWDYFNLVLSCSFSHIVVQHSPIMCTGMLRNCKKL